MNTLYIYIYLYYIKYHTYIIIFHNILQIITKCNKVPLKKKKRLWSNTLMEANVLAVDHPKYAYWAIADMEVSCIKWGIPKHDFWVIFHTSG